MTQPCEIKRNAMMTFRLEQELLDAVEAYAKARQLSQAAVIRGALQALLLYEIGSRL